MHCPEARLQANRTLIFPAMLTPLTRDSPTHLTWDSPSLNWDSTLPGPPAPKPKKKPFHRKPKPNPEPTPPPHIMSTFQYNPTPKSTGGFTTRAAKGDLVSIESRRTEAVDFHWEK